MVKLTGFQLDVLLFFAVAQAFLGHLLAEKDRRKLGRTPWGVPSVIWAIIWFMSLVLGLALWFLAHRSEVRRAAQSPWEGSDVGSSPASPGASRSVGSDFPAYPRPAGGGTSVPSPSALPAVPAVQAVPESPPKWHPDPSGRFHFRWWTGSEWTSYVSIHGRVEVDINPDQRIGPYPS